MALGGQFDVIYGHQMPVMDGFAAARKITRGRCKLPIVALTANAMKGEEERCRSAGCSEYVAQTINVDRLLQTLAGVVGVLRRGFSIGAKTRTIEHRAIRKLPILKSTLQPRTRNS